MKALAEVPPAKLSSIDEAFVLLDGGLGTVFSASLARRAALQRDHSNSNPTSPSNATACRRILGTEEVAPAARGLTLMKKAVTRIGAQTRILKAQRATMEVFNQFGEEPLRNRPCRNSAHILSVGAMIEEESDGPSLFLADALGDVIRPQQRHKTDLSIDLGQDPALTEWAQTVLKMHPEQLEGLDSSPHFEDKLCHQMLCWEAMRVNKLPLVKTKSGHGLAVPLVYAGRSLLGPALRQWPRSEEAAEAQAQSSEELGQVPASSSRSSSRSLSGEKRYATREEKKDQLARHAQALAAGRATVGIRQRADADPLATPRERARSVALARQGKHSLARRGKTRKEDSLDALGEPSPGFWKTLNTQRDYLGEELRRLPPAGCFVEPHCKVSATKICNTPEFSYLRRCELAGLVPCQVAWRDFYSDVGIVDVKNRALSDADIQAVVETAVQCAEDGQILKVLDLSGNSLSDSGLGQVTKLLAECPAVCKHLGSISLAQNSLLRMRSPDVLSGLSGALKALPALTMLDLSGVKLQGQTASTLAAGLRDCRLLRQLRLADCGLGRHDQAECVAISALLGGECAVIESADFAGNFFGRAGFAAIGAAMRKTKLRELSFANNGGGRWAESDVRIGRGNGREQPTSFHPAQLLLEGLQFNMTLEKLDLSGCEIGPDTAFVLEDAFHQHTQIKTLLLSENPLGDDGLRCVLRLLINSRSAVSTCNICGNRSSDARAHQVKYRSAQPGGTYSLNLKYPHERAILRSLLRFGGKLRESTFRFFKFDPKQPKLNVEKHPGTDSWVVPSQGVYSFTFQPPLSKAAKTAAAAQTALTNAQSAAAAAAAAAAAGMSGRGAEGSLLTQSMPLSARGPQGRRPSAWQGKFGSSIGASDANVGTSAMGGNSQASRQDCLARTPTRQLSKDSAPLRSSRGGIPKDRIDVPSTVDSSAWENDGVEIANLLRNARTQVSALRFPLIRNMFLSLVTQEQQRRFVCACSKDVSFNAVQVAKLCEDRPEVAAEIASSLFSSIRGRSAQLLLIGNPHLANMNKVAKSIASCLWFQEGNLTGRYRLQLTEPAECSVAENCLLVNAWETEVGRLIGSPDVSQRGNYEMLRNEEHNELPFMYSRDWLLPSYGWLRFDYSSIRRPPSSVAPMPEASEVTRYLRSGTSAPSAKLKALRAVSVHMYISTHQLRNLLLCFPEGEHRQDAFCMLHTRVVDSASMLGPSLLHSDAVLRESDRYALFNRLGHLHLLAPLNPELVPFHCCLAVYEERRVVEFLVQLTIHEAVGKVLRRSDDGRYVAVPASWADKGVPCEDVTFRCRYETATLNSHWRHLLAAKYCVGFHP